MRDWLDLPYRRPLAIGAFFFVLTAAAAYCVSLLAAAAVFGLLLSALTGCLIFLPGGAKKSRLRFLLVLIVLFSLTALIAGFAAQNRERRSVAAVRKEGALLTVLVTEVEDRDSALRVVGRVEAADNLRVKNLSVLFYVYREELSAGDRIAVRLSLYPGETETNGGTRINGKLLEFVSRRPEADSLTVWIGRMQRRITESLFSHMPDEQASVANAMLTGSREEMPLSLRNSFQRAGISHIVVVSGLHISFFLGSLSKLLRRLRFAPVRALLLFLAAAGLAAFYGFTPSVIRASVMGLMVFCGDLFDYRNDGPTSLSAAAVLLLLINPKTILNLSFQLSFLCCFAIVVLYPMAEKRRRRPSGQRGWRRYLAAVKDGFLLTLIINLTTMPLLIFQGMPISLVSVLTNPAVILFVPLLLFFAVLTAAFSSLLPWAAFLPGAAASVIAGGIIRAADFFGGYRFSAVDANEAFMKIWAAAAVLLSAAFLLFPRLRKRIRGRYAAGAIALSLVAGILVNGAIRKDLSELLLYNGNALLLREGRESALVLEKVSESDMDYLSSYLLTRGIDRVDGIVFLDSAEEAVRRQAADAFPDADYYAAGEGTVRFSVSGMRVAVSNDCVIIETKGRRILAAGRQQALTEADILLWWRSAKQFPDTSAEVVCYEDLLAEGQTALCGYGYADAVEILIGERGERVRVR